MTNNDRRAWRECNGNAMSPHRSSDKCRRVLPAGKLPPWLLKPQLDRVPPGKGRVLIGPRYGDDATVIDIGERLLVCTCDPITLASRQIGRYAVHINANDVAVMGARPLWFWATILLPEGRSDERLVEGIFSDIRAACAELGIELCGGHTEITAGLTRPILSGFMAGEAERARLADKKTVRPGDDIILSRGIAIEGTATIASEQPERLVSLDPDLVRRARGFLSDPGISVVREALLAVETAEVHGMHDPTEGGLFTGVRELAETAGVGLEIAGDQIHVLPETTAICALLGLDPMGLLASGSLIVVCDHGSARKILRAYREKHIPARIIGRIEERRFGIMLRDERGLIPLPEYERDEITKII